MEWQPELYPEGGTETVLIAQAAEAISEPSVTDYATKEQLMSAFKTDNNGVGQNIGKLIFGKNSDGKAQEWYILKKDYFATQNTLIFAASPITTGVQFHSTSADYPDGIHANYYFNSDLDKLLANMAGNTQFFSTKEQELLGETEIKTKNGTAKRKLYALNGSYTTNNNIILAGEYDDIKISIANYCSGSDAGEFWLRSATDRQDADEGEKAQCVLVVDPSQKKVARDELVTEKFDVWPAVDLNLSNVLFASSYDGSNSNNRDGMILRLDGKNKDIGTVTYNPRTNKVTVERGSVSGNVRLVVQYGKNANERGIFDQTVYKGGNKTWTGSEIFGNVNISEDDWSKCKIWMEIKEDGMFYAVEATEDKTPITIDSIIAQIDEPEAGRTLSQSVDTGDNITAKIIWKYEDGQTVPADKTAEYYPACYIAHITFTPAKGYVFSNSTKIQINDKKVTSVPIDGKITVETPFSSSKDKLKSITAPASITVANGTAYKDMNLPAQVAVVTEGCTVNKADVSWNTLSPGNGKYDPAVLTEQTVTLEGKVTCPETINANGVNLTTSITITISAAENNTVEPPIANPEAGTYTENQTVTLESATEGASIYYTTNGVEPSSTAGTKYTGPLTVAGMEGQPVEKNIKAIAVKSGMQDSLVMTYKYTIELPSQTPEIKVPVITSQPQDVTVKEGETATFIVKATGTDLTYQWEIDTKGDNDFVSISGTTGKGASYTTGIRNMENNGTKYRCIVSNSAGSVTSRSATLTVADDTTPPSETTYIITATAGANGSISPSGSVEVKEGADQTFTITADEGYEIENLKVDSSDVSAASSYTFNNVTEEHSIEATFKQKVTNPDPGQPENPDPGKTEDPNPAEKPKPEVKKDEAPASSQAPQHEHSFGWVTVQTASAAQDGLEELRCSCGIVKERSVVPASQAYVNELYQNLSQALAEGEVSFDSGRIYTISDYLIRKLQERADVTTTITFEYNQDKYRMMIPAGVDYSELLEDEDYFYGYFYFAKKVGARVESL